MMKSRKILLLITFCCGAAISYAQQTKIDSTTDKYRAVHWGLNDGLSQACALHMLKDVNGFLWIGTQGELSRFDGSVFKNYYYDPQKSGTINAKVTIGGLFEDSLHNIWIGTNKDLHRYDIKADTFTRSFPVAPLAVSKDEIICSDLTDSIYGINIRTFAKRSLATLVPADSLWVGFGLSYSFFDESSNCLWMLRSDHRNGQWSGGGLLQISLATGEKKYHRWNCFKNIPGHDHSAESMCYDPKRNCLWLNSSEGLMQFTLDDKQFHFAGALNSFFNGKDYHRWVGISLDLQGRVWLATNPKGIVIYDPSDHSVKLPFSEGSSHQKEISDFNATIYCDKDGITWSGFWLGKGIYQLLPFSSSIKHHKPEASSTNIGEIINFRNAGNGKMWINSRDWRIHRIFDTKSDTMQVIDENILPASLRNTDFQLIWIDSISGKVYLDCLEKGIWVLDMNDNKCQRLIFNDSANHEIILSQLAGTSPFKDGLLISSIEGNRQSIFFVNSKSMAAHETFSFPVEPGRKFYLELADERFIFLKGSDVTGNLTYTYSNRKWVRSPNPLDSISWRHIIYNGKDHSYWLVSEKRLIHYSNDLKLIHVYAPAEGLPELDIYSLVADAKGNIWFNTDRSIHQLNIETGVFSTLSEKDGFNAQNFSLDPVLHMGTDGDLYLGGGIDGEGFVRLSPDKYTSASSSVYLRSLEINQKPFPLSMGVNNLDNLSLRYFENKITLETGVIDYYAKGKSNIRYKLEAEGMNASWQYAPAYYTIRYENLSPGKYRLVIQASNAANEFSGPEKILSINISPAFWNTWWFRIPVAILLIDLLYFIIRRLERQKFRRQLERSEKETQFAEMGQKTAELQQQATELEMQALRAQMNPHFIFNSLNSINRFILQNNRLQASEYLTKFSRLVRMILQNSQNSLITLESELESMELYLDLEAVRFEHRFGYKITVPKEMDISVLKVPPLIIQPYAENAIWHGLMHKEDKGQLDIEVTEEGDYLFFKIADNGVGRKAAAAQAGKSATKHKSMGLKITAARIAMLQSSNGAESPVTINDLVNDDGSAAGTEVIIRVPVISVS